MSGLGLTLFVLVCVALFLWLAKEYTRSHPLDLTSRVPQVEKYLLPDGVKLQVDKAELFFDDGPVLRVSGLGVRGVDGNLGIYIEQAAIQLASTQLFLLSAAPKVIEASGVTLRLVRDEQGVSIAGLDLPQGGNKTEGVVDWLNGIGWDRLWGRVKSVKVADLNLLVRDDVQQAEWVLEQGNMSVGRYPEEGEKGTLTAVVRRLYGDTKLRDLDNVPVLVSFAHLPKADNMEIRGRLDRANAQMVTDYFPPQFKDLLQAQGQVEVGTRLMTENRMAQPWVTMRLTDVKVQPPKGYSKGLKFPKLTVTMSYSPPVEGVSESDVLSIIDLEATTSRGNVLAASGTIAGLQSDPLVNLSLTSPAGPGQGVFDLFPDQMHGFSKALEWLRPNVQGGSYRNLKAQYLGRPSAFPGCGENCGTLNIDAEIDNGVVRFLKELSPIKATAPATFAWRGETLDVAVPDGKVGNQVAKDIKVQMTNIFSPSPTELRVTGALTGDVNEVLAELGKMPETHGKIPQGITGNHASTLDILVPLPRGQETTFAMTQVIVSSSLANVNVHGLDELRGLDFAAPRATASLSADKTLRVTGDGTLGGSPMKADWSMNIAPGLPSLMKINAVGTVGGEWLMAQASTTLVSMTGPVGISANLQQDASGKWLFGVNADGGQALVKLPDANFTKAKGERLSVEANGSYVPSGTIILEKLDVLGNKIALGGAVRWVPGDIDASVIELSQVKVGDTDVSINFGGGKAVVTGKRLDLRGYDLFGSEASDGRPDKVPSTQPENLQVNLNLDEVLTENGKLNKLVADLQATKGRWDVQKLSGLIDGNLKVNMQKVALKGQTGRKKLTIDVDDLGRTLDTIGIYKNLAHGKMSGEITYDTPDVGGGLIKIENFELKNPPFLVQLLSLLSLEQLLAGTSTTVFKTATIPVRVDGGMWYVDNASFEGPSMSLRLDGSYDRTSKQLDFDGKMAPAIPLNRLVGKIPLLGTLLTGSQDGVLVADFKLKGDASDPQINVRPLSVITPGLLKDAWRGLTGGDTTNKPKPKVIDGRSK